MKPAAVNLFTLFFLTLILSGCSSKKSAITAESMLGNWYTIKGDVEAYSFLKDGKNYIFTGTMGMRPVAFGRWKIEKEKFFIIMDNGTTTEYSFTLQNDTLAFNGGAEIYTRTIPPEVQFPEVRILKDLAFDLGNLKFSKPRPSDLKWKIRIDSLKNSKELNLKAYSISLASTLSSDDIGKIAVYLKDHGFEQDTLIVTEICKGFRDEKQIVTICTSRDKNANNDSINIIVTSGLIK